MTYKAFVSYSHAADNQLAPMLQSALQKFAKPFYKLRAIDIFRDKTSLHLTPELWPEIQKAIRQSEFFILMASPESAKSDWVQREVVEWLTLKQDTPANLLLVLTDGSLEWDNDANDFDWQRTDALPQNLRGKFKSEPFFSDLRWVKTTQDLSLRHPQFLDEIGTLGATLHGRPKDTMIGEDVKQHRILKATAFVTLVILLVLAVGASAAAYVATQQRKEAQEQTRIANEQRGIADEQRGIARGQQKIAEVERDNASNQARIAGEERDKAAEAARKESIARTNAERAAELERQARLEAEANLRLATARQLAAQSGQALVRSHASSAIGADDPQRGVLLALESLNRSITPEGTRAMRLALATLEGNETPALVEGKTLTLQALGSQAGWAVVLPDELPDEQKEPSGILIDPRSGKEIDRSGGLSVPDALKAAADPSEWRVKLSEKGAITVWTTSGNRPVLSKYEGDSVSEVAISRDGSLVAAAGAFGQDGFTVRVWQVKGWRHIADLPHEWNLTRMAFSEDGKWLTTVTSYVSMDAAVLGETALVGSTIRVWNVRDRRLVMHESLAAHGGIQSMAFSPDGLWLATTSPGYQLPPKLGAEPETLDPSGTTLRLWQLTPDDLRKTACSKLKRNLSASEWTTFIGTKRTTLTCPGLPVPEE
jgi:TIR domain-containing protein/WD40 domain-containing protein